MTMPSAVEPKAPNKDEHSGGLLHHCLGHFATGVTIVSYRAGEGTRGLTINSFTAVSLDPPLILICLDKRSNAIEVVPYSGFAINVLGSDQKDLAMHFSGRKRASVAPQWRDVGGVPLLSSNLAWLRCEPASVHDAGDHTIVVGQVMDFGASGRDPLCFFRGQFLQFDDIPSPVDPKN